jgi:hypothetical protein
VDAGIPNWIVRPYRLSPDSGLSPGWLNRPPRRARRTSGRAVPRLSHREGTHLVGGILWLLRDRRELVERGGIGFQFSFAGSAAVNSR